MDSLMLRHFREEANINIVNFQVSATTPNVVLQANRLRYAIILPNSNATRVIWHFGENWTSQRIGWFSTTASMFGCINEDVFGEAIRLPLWGWCDAAFNTEITEISYDPTRYAQMQRYIHEYLSRYGTP